MSSTPHQMSKTSEPKAQAPVRAAEIVREYGPFAGVDKINGITHDGQLVWAATGATLLAFDPQSGQPARTLDPAGDAGTAFDGTHLYQIVESRIDKIDPATGEVLRTIESNRFVTGVTWVDGELWHGTWEGEESEIRRIDPDSGTVLERLGLPRGTGVSGMESNGADLFYLLRRRTERRGPHRETAERKAALNGGLIDPTPNGSSSPLGHRMNTAIGRP